ncbi:MAG: hypothetical protein ABI432_12840 [Flavobacteriales bacterium]
MAIGLEPSALPAIGFERPQDGDLGELRAAINSEQVLAAETVYWFGSPFGISG